MGSMKRLNFTLDSDTVELTRSADCHTCGTPHGKGEVLFHPVFQRGSSPKALPELPAEDWLDCPDCVQKTSEEF